MKGTRTVYHLAAYARLWAKDPDLYRKLNVEGTRNVLQAAIDEHVEKMVYVSTAGVVGPSADRPMDEEMPRNAGFFNSYERTKWEAEQLCLSFSKKGLPVTIVNPARIYGPGPDTGSNPVTKLVELFIQGKWKVVPGSGNDIGSYCYVDDVVDGLVQAMEKGKSGERYLLGGVNASFNELIETISKISGVRSRVRHLPFPILEAFSYGQLLHAKITGKPPLVTPDWLRKYRYNWALDSTKAQRELGYQIRPLAEGLAETIRWIMDYRLSPGVVSSLHTG
jgi:farnesol dehydrogenase